MAIGFCKGRLKASATKRSRSIYSLRSMQEKMNDFTLTKRESMILLLKLLLTFPI